MLDRREGSLWAWAPAAIRGRIEARGLGILRARPAAAPVRVVAEVDLDRTESERLPPARRSERLGCPLALVLRSDSPAFAAALFQLLKEGLE